MYVTNVMKGAFGEKQEHNLHLAQPLQDTVASSSLVWPTDFCLHCRCRRLDEEPLDFSNGLFHLVTKK
jgi:hypothetical protein